MLENYILARQAEEEGRYTDALEIYTSMNFLDSLERSVSLVGSSKEQQYVAAEELFETGRYIEAAEAFSVLGQYKDSASHAEECLARVTPEPTPSPTPIPSSKPTVTPTPKPTMKPSSVPSPSPTLHVSWPAGTAAFIGIIVTDSFYDSPTISDFPSMLGEVSGFKKVYGNTSFYSGEYMYTGVELSLNETYDYYIKTGVEAVLLFPTMGVNYDDMIRSFNLEGIPVHVFSSEDPKVIYNELCTLYGKTRSD